MRTMVVLSLALLAGCAKEPEVNPAAHAVEELYRVRIESQMTGAPNEAELALMTPYLSSELRTLLAAAAKLRDDEAKRAPDDKPPFADGDLFTSLFEGPTAAKVKGTGNRLAVEFQDEKAKPPSVWTDYVFVKEEGGHWVVSDVEYAGQWDFANKGKLVESLKSSLPK